MSAVKGLDRAVAKINRIPATVRTRVEEVLEQIGGIVLQDMQAMTPLDAAHQGAHARDGLVAIVSGDGLQVNVGLPSADLVNNYYWFRFLDLGTKGGEVTFWRRGTDGKRAKHVMQVPARAALHIRERALDGNADVVRGLIAEAIAQGLADA